MVTLFNRLQNAPWNAADLLLLGTALYHNDHIEVLDLSIHATPITIAGKGLFEAYRDTARHYKRFKKELKPQRAAPYGIGPDGVASLGKWLRHTTSLTKLR